MANITVTKANVRPLSGATVRRYDAGGSLSVGDAVFLASDGDVEGAIDATATSAWAIGIVVGCPDGDTGAVAGEPVDVVVHGPVELASGLTPGDLAYVGDSAGMVSTAAGTKEVVVGYVETASAIFVRPQIIDFT